jgi:hypothetical protein
VIRAWLPILLLALSNVAMTFAWYGHLRRVQEWSLPKAILVSWGIALVEYCLMVPANRLGYGAYTLVQLKIVQEVLTLLVFAGFAAWVMHQKLTLNHLYAGLCLVGAVFFTFRK